MKLQWRLVFFTLMTVLLLAACGTSNENEQNEPSAVEEEQPKVDETDKQQETSADVDEDKKDDQSSSQQEDEKSDSQDEQTIALEDAVETASDTQDYLISVLPEYTLTGEEPGRDVLFKTDQSEIFMRIETVPVDQDTLTNFVENGKEVLQAASENADVEQVTDDNLQVKSNGIENASTYKSVGADNTFYVVVFERDGLAVRLTIFDNANSDYAESFVQMGATIHTK